MLDFLAFDVFLLELVKSLEVGATFVIGIVAFKHACENHLGCGLIVITRRVISQVYITLTMILEKFLFRFFSFPKVSLPLSGVAAIR